MKPIEGFIRWDGEQLHIHKKPLSTVLATELQANGHYYVDLDCDKPEDRYGRMEDRGQAYLKWVYWPLHDFPKEFRTRLLLLGVT